MKFALSAVVLVLAVGCADDSQLVKDHGAIQQNNSGASEESLGDVQQQGTGVPENVYFGDLHVHTRYSMDAYLLGNEVTPDDSYRFAKGELVKSSFGDDMQLQVPLDFYAVSDHGYFLGVAPQWADPSSKVGQLAEAKPFHGVNEQKNLNSYSAQKRTVLFRDNLRPMRGVPAGWWGKIKAKLTNNPAQASATFDYKAHKNAWQDTIDAAQRHNDPGNFTAFIAYEWTASTPAPESASYHRNVIFRSSKAPKRPFSSWDSSDPEKLWQWMDTMRAKGVDSLAIPHNPNQSNGQVFKQRYSDGRPIDKAHSEQRMRNEPLVEITQAKGTSETHPRLSPEDEWADFEIINSRKGRITQYSRPHGSYVREAIINGLALEQEGRGNPFKVGFIGSTDTHSGTTSVVESAYIGTSPLKVDAENTGAIPVSQKRIDYIATLSQKEQARGKVILEDEGTYFDDMRTAQFSASGLAAVWAQENTRESIFNALRRKESYATSGSRIKLRFFGGFDLTSLQLTDKDLVDKAYSQGVPMGGDLVADAAQSPEFLVWAQRDPNAAPLQRIQIIKGWYDGGYKKQINERVYDMACSGGLEVDSQTHRCPDNGATVNLEDCSITESLGSPEMKAHWTDPDFTAGQNAVYYVRVLENPTCRWSIWAAVRAGVKPRAGLAKTIQERAWSSPIWYTYNE